MRNKRFVFSLLLLSMLILGCSDYSSSEYEGYIEVQDSKIHYKVSGIGKPILLIHGGYLNMDMWAPQVNYLTDNGYRVIRYSDLGHGKTESGNDPIFGYEIVEALRKELNEPKLSVIGLSWGAMIAVDYVLNYPKRVDNLILTSPGLNGWEYFKDSLAAQNNAERKIAFGRADTAEVARLFYKTWVAGPRRQESEVDSEFLEYALGMIHSTFSHHWGQDWSVTDTMPAIDRLNQIQARTLIVIGDQDAQDIALIANEYNREIPNSKLIVLKNVAHLLNLEDSATYNLKLGEFLQP